MKTFVVIIAFLVGALLGTVGTIWYYDEFVGHTPTLSNNSSLVSAFSSSVSIPTIKLYPSSVSVKEGGAEVIANGTDNKGFRWSIIGCEKTFSVVFSVWFQEREEFAKNMVENIDKGEMKVKAFPIPIYVNIKTMDELYKTWRSFRDYNELSEHWECKSVADQGKDITPFLIGGNVWANHLFSEAEGYFKLFDIRPKEALTDHYEYPWGREEARVFYKAEHFKSLKTSLGELGLKVIYYKEPSWFYKPEGSK